MSDDWDIRTREGMPFGALPYDTLVHKLEETDPAFVSEVRGDDEFHDLADEYQDYVRAEVVDWAPDAPLMEADHPRRDPALSRSALNLRYNGTRGSQPELPRHPELFIGFTGNDPRGAGTDPRFDVMRGHMTARASNLEARMLDSDDNFTAERPWTGQSISYGMKELHRRLQSATRVFTVQKEGRPWGRNTAADRLAGLRARQVQYWNGEESLPDAAERERFFGSDYRGAGDAEGGGVRGVDRRRGADSAPWRRSDPDGDLAVQFYGQTRSQGRALTAPGALGGGRKRAAAGEQDIAEALATRRARGANRQVLGATMAAAARNRRHLREARPDGDPGVSYELAAVGTAAAARDSADVARIHRLQAADADLRAAGTVQDDEGGGPAGAGLRPAAHPERAARAAETSHAEASPYLGNAAAIVRGLREGTASGRRRIAGRVAAAGVLGDLFEGASADLKRGLRPGGDYGRAQRLAEAPLARAAAAEGLEVASYRGAAPVADDRRVAHARRADQTLFGPEETAAGAGKSKVPQHRGGASTLATLGDADADTFGANAAAPGGMAGGAPGLKAVRNMAWDGEHLAGAVSEGLEAE